MRGGATKVGLFIVDPQNDFCSGGALAVTNAEEIFAPINKLKAKYEGLEQPIFISQDWHPKGHISFATTHGQAPFSTKELKAGELTFTQVLWPEHCVQGSEGAKVNPALNVTGKEIYILKGKDSHNLVDSYSAFGDAFGGKFEKTELQEKLQPMGLQRLIVVGLATDYCVSSTAIDAKIFNPSLEVIVIEETMRGVAPNTSIAAIDKMRAAGVKVFATIDEYEKVMPE
jgi:nicotinamidase/pyrazinamidase